MNEIDTFLNSGLLKERTKYSYKSIIYEYFTIIFNIKKEKRISNKTILKIEKQLSTYFNKSDQEYQKYIMKYFNYLKEKNSHSIITNIRYIKSFHEYFEIELSRIFYKKIFKTQSNRAVTRDKIPSKEIINQWLHHSSAKERALILIATTTGLRINEILNLDISDIDTTKNKEEPYTVYVNPDTKSGNSRITFTNQETINAINEWLKKQG